MTEAQQRYKSQMVTRAIVSYEAAVSDEDKIRAISMLWDIAWAERELSITLAQNARIEASVDRAIARALSPLPMELAGDAYDMNSIGCLGDNTPGREPDEFEREEDAARDAFNKRRDEVNDILFWEEGYAY
jgi:hypothetical protein